MTKSFPLLALLCLGSLMTSVLPLQWNKLILTQHWPQTFCIMEHCEGRFDYWAIHGLWPNKGNMCNSSLHFNESQIKDLIPEMEKWWPDLLHNGSQFWKHEWQKHGTCAVQLEALDNEHKYFSKAMELYNKMNLNGVLAAAKIVPSETETYSLDQIETALTKFYNVTVKIQCISQRKLGEVQTMGQIEICFDTTFQLVDCEKHLNEVLRSGEGGDTGYHVCDRNMKVYYPPLKNKHYW